MKTTASNVCFKGGMAILLILLTGNMAHAQNYSQAVPESADPVNSRNEKTDYDDFSDISLIYNAGVKEVSQKGTGENLPSELEATLYTLGKEDVIEVQVLRHPEVSGQYIINSEGKIQYDFIGDINVEGLKKDEVKDIITKHLEEYIISPNVTVKITGYNSKVVYVVGEVGRPGKIIMKGDTITVRDAIIQAGLPLLSGKLTKGRLITPSDSGLMVKENVNVYKLLYEGDLRENLTMNPGDMFYIPPTFLAKTMRVLQPITQPIGEAAGTGATVGGF